MIFIRVRNQNTTINNKVRAIEQISLLNSVKENDLAHIENLFKKVSYKLYALQRIRKFIIVMQAKTLTSFFVNNQFNYCAIIWIFCSGKLKLRLENINN